MGRILDSLGFQLPQMNVVTSDPSKLYEGESSLELQKGKTDAARIQNLRNLVGGVTQLGMRIAAPEIKKERAESEQKGYIAGLEGSTELEGNTYEERNQSLKKKFQQLRKGGEIGLVDDPYFQRGMSKAEGKASIMLFNNAVDDLYVKLQSNPTDFYDTPDLFETELRRIHDTFYVTLPQNTDIQEGFLSHATPVLEKYKQRYKAEFHEYSRKQFIGNQYNSVGASIFSNNTFSDFIDGENDANVRDVWISFSKKFMKDIREGNIDEDEIRKYVGDEDPETFLRNAVSNPNTMRTALKKYNFNESVEEIQDIYDELYSFAGSGIGGLGAEPTDIIIESIIKQTHNPITAQTMIMSLNSGSGKLKDTAKGKAALQSLHQKALDYTRQQESYKRSQRNYVQASQIYDKSEELAILDADISTFNQILLQNQKSTSPNVPNTPEALGDAFLRRIDFLRDIDREEYSKRLGRIREAMNKANSPASAYNDEKKKADVTSSISDIEKGIRGGGDPNSLARSLLSSRDILGGTTDAAFEGMISQTNSDLFSNPTEQTIGNFWKTAEVIKEVSQMGGPGYSMSPTYSSESVVGNNPDLIQILLEADSRGVLDSFVGSDSNVRQAVRNLNQFSGSPEQLQQAFSDELKTIDQLKREAERTKVEERQFEGFNPSKIKIQATPNGKSKVVGPLGLYQSLGVGREMKPEPYLIDYFAKSMGAMYGTFIRQGYSPDQATLETTKAFRDQFPMREVKDGNFVRPWKDDVTSIRLIEDKGLGEFLDTLNPDKEEQNKGIENFLQGLYFISNEDMTSQVAQAEIQELEVFVDNILESEINKNVNPQDLIPGYEQPVFNEDIYSKTSRGIEDPDMKFAFQNAWEIRKNLPESELDKDNFLVFVSNMAENYARTTGKTEIEAQEEIKQALFSSDKNGDLGFSIFNPEFVTKKVFSRIQTYRNQNTSLRDKLAPVYTDEILNEITVLDNLASRLKDNQLDFSEHSLDQENSFLTLQPAADNRFIVLNDAGKPLSYKNGSIFTFTKEDLGDAVTKQQIRNPQQIWSVVGKEVNPKKESVTNEEFHQELKDYFENFPDNIPLSYFITTYKGYGKFMYQEYKRSK